MNIQIRPATRADLPKMIALVIELAIYEKAPEAVTASLDDYETAFEKDIFAGHVAKNESGDTIGMTIFYDAWSTWKGPMLYLEDFVVTEKYRAEGVGRLLFEAFLKEARDRKCVLTKWQVLDWNTPAIRFYEKIGATIEREWWNGKLFL